MGKDTHSSETVYLSARGSQATLPIHTPRATSLSRRPRFLPRMVSKVPPSKGPLRGSICRSGDRGKGRSEPGCLSHCHMCPQEAGLDRCSA